MPTNWVFGQYNEYVFSRFELDKDTVSKKDNDVTLDTRHSSHNRNAAITMSLLKYS